MPRVRPTPGVIPGLLNILPLVKGTQDFNPIFSIAETDHMRSGSDLQVPRPHVNRTSQLKSCGDGAVGVTDLVCVRIGLIHSPHLGAVVPYPLQVALGAQADHIKALRADRGRLLGLRDKNPRQNH